MIRFVSFDIGKVNFAQYVEEISINTITNNPEEIPLLGTRIHTGVYDLREDKTSDKLDMATRKNIISHLESFVDTFGSNPVFIIEEQFSRTFSRGRKGQSNTQALKMGELVMGWVLTRYPDSYSEFIRANQKTKLLGAPKKLDKPQRKKWAEKKARELYTLRKDQVMIDIFNLQDTVYRKRVDTPARINKYLDRYPHSQLRDLAKKVVMKQKLDDISDAFLQVQAFKIREAPSRFLKLQAHIHNGETTTTYSSFGEAQANSNAESRVGIANDERVE